MIDIPHEPLLFDLFYGGKAAGEETEEDLKSRMKASIPEVTVETPSFRNIHISNIICKGSGRAMFFNGLPEMPIRNVTVKNVIISDAKEGVVISQADMQLLNLDLTDDSLMETPHRIAKMYVDEIFSGLDYANFPKIS